MNIFVGQSLKSVTTTQDTATLDELRELIDGGHLKPVVDQVVGLEQAPQAVALVEHGSPAGKVIVRVLEPHDAA